MPPIAGLHDISPTASGFNVSSKVRAPIRAAGDEDFDTSADGQPVVEHPEPGEVIWRDDRGVTCRRWNWRQCVRTRITHATTSAMFVLDGLAALGTGGLRAAEAELTESLARLSPGASFASRLLAKVDGTSPVD